MNSGFTFNDNNDDITAGINTNVIKLIDKAIESNSKESFYKIDDFCYRILNLSIKNKYLYHFKEYLEIIVEYYIISNDYLKKNGAIYDKMFQICSECSARRIKEIFVPINYIFKNSDLNDKIFYNKYKYLAFNSYNQLLFKIVYNKDFKMFDYTINQIENVFLGETIGMSQFFIFSNINSDTDKTKINNYIEDIQIQIYLKETILGIRYWLYYLYENNQFSQIELSSFIEKINKLKRTNFTVEFWEIELLFSKLNSYNFSYFNWNRWDYKIHPEGEFHTLPSVFDWILTGFIVDSVTQGGINNISKIDINLIDKGISANNKSLLINELLNRLNKIEFNKQWEVFFTELNIDDYKDRINDIREYLISINSDFEIQKAREIILEELDENKVYNFRHNFYDNWNKSKLIRKIFEQFNVKEKYEGKIEKLKLIGKNVFIEKAKVYFIEGKHYQFIYGISDLGIQLSKWEDEFYFQTVLGNKSANVYSSIIDGLQQTIKILKKRKNSPSIIFADSSLGWQGIRSNDKWIENKTLDIADGFYDLIPVVFVNSKLMQRKFIIADFGKAFTMLYREIKDGIDNELKVEVYKVSDKTAEEKLKENPQYWKKIGENAISDEQALIYIKTSIIVDFEVKELFEVNDDNAFEIGLIEDNKSNIITASLA